MKGRPSLLLYGQFAGHHSNAMVSRGVAAGLSANGIEVQLCTTDAGFGFVGGGYQDLWGGPFHVGPRTGGAAAFVGYAGRASSHLRFHETKIGFFIAESEVLPADWGIVAGSCDLVVTPSSWMTRAHVAAGVRRDRVMTVAHGLHPCYSQALPPTVSGEGLRFLHVAGARDFLHRKGTPELIEAFAQTFGPTYVGPKARLTIRTPSSPTVHELVQATQLAHLFDIDGHSETLPPSTMREYLLHARDGASGALWSAVVQPSRAEAFGLVPCEARACGLPVLLTAGSGHRDHLEPSDITIQTGPAASIKVNGIPNGMAPTVSAGAIGAALRTFAERQAAYQAAARQLAKGYSLKYDWTVLMRPVAERIRRLCKGGRSLAERVG